MFLDYQLAPVASGGAMPVAVLMETRPTRARTRSQRALDAAATSDAAAELSTNTTVDYRIHMQAQLSIEKTITRMLAFSS